MVNLKLSQASDSMELLSILPKHFLFVCLLFRTLMPILQSTAKIGNPKQSKHAIRCINTVCKNKEAIFAQIFEVRIHWH